LSSQDDVLNFASLEYISEVHMAATVVMLIV